jgi:hypothetical protein
LTENDENVKKKREFRREREKVRKSEREEVWYF